MEQIDNAVQASRRTALALTDPHVGLPYPEVALSLVAKNLFSTASSPPAADLILLHKGVLRKACPRDCMVIAEAARYWRAGCVNGQL
jgi:hypothetical protein